MIIDVLDNVDEIYIDMIDKIDISYLNNAVILCYRLMTNNEITYDILLL